MRILLSILALAAAVAVASAAPGGEGPRRAPADDLATSTAVPWNPPQPVERRRTWERVVLFPQRMVSLPLSGGGLLMERVMFHAEEMGLLPSNAAAARPAGPRQGVSISQPSLGGRAGLGLAVRYLQPVLSDRMKMNFSARYAGSIRNYNGTVLSLSGQPLTLQYGVNWRPEEPYYGIGMSSLEDAVSSYALHSEYARLAANYERRPRNAGRFQRTSAGVWVETRNDILSSGRWPDNPSYEENFPELGATLGERVEHFTYGATFSLDNRTGVSHWSRGHRLMLSAERHGDPVEALALRVGSPTGVAYNRYLAEAETGVSFRDDPRTLRVMARVVDQHGPRDQMLPSDLATLGGNIGLPGFATGRFHDMDLLLTKLSYLYPIGRRLEVELRSAWGAVYPDVWSDARLDQLEHSVGFSVRGRYAAMPVAAIGVDWSREGPRITWALGGLQ